MTNDHHRTPECACLNCGRLMNAAGSTDGSPIPPPAEGDLSVCLRCGAVMKYDSAGKVRGMTQAEMDKLKADTEQMNMLAKLVRGIRFVRQLREQRN